MDNIIIGRDAEKEILRQRIESGNPELIAIYGRRRIGKTFLVRLYFKDTFSFYLTGIYQGSKKEQLGEFKREQRQACLGYAERRQFLERSEKISFPCYPCVPCEIKVISNSRYIRGGDMFVLDCR